MEFLRNTILLWLAAVFLILGYIFLATGSLSVGPLLLFVGYCVLLPIFLWRTFRFGSGE